MEQNPSVSVYPMIPINTYIMCILILMCVRNTYKCIYNVYTICLWKYGLKKLTPIIHRKYWRVFHDSPGEMLLGFCPARFGVLFCSVVLDCGYTH